MSYTLLSLVCDRILWEPPYHLLQKRAVTETWQRTGLLLPEGTDVLCRGSRNSARAVVYLLLPTLKPDIYLFLKPLVFLPIFILALINQESETEYG